MLSFDFKATFHWPMDRQPVGLIVDRRSVKPALTDEQKINDFLFPGGGVPDDCEFIGLIWTLTMDGLSFSLYTSYLGWVENISWVVSSRGFAVVLGSASCQLTTIDYNCTSAIWILSYSTQNYSSFTPITNNYSKGI